MNTLIVLSGSIDIAEHYFHEHPEYKNYRNSIIGINEDRIRGICNADILFLYGWWGRRQSYEIIKNIEAILDYGKSNIVGDEKYIPPYFLEYSNILKIDRKGSRIYNDKREERNKIHSRFEILDL